MSRVKKGIKRWIAVITVLVLCTALAAAGIVTYGKYQMIGSKAVNGTGKL